MPKPPVKSDDKVEAARESLRAGKIKHPEILAVLRAKSESLGALSSDECKEMIGWITEPEGEDWGKDFLFRDLYNRKVRLSKNTTNRPFRKSLAERYALEHLRGKWSLNLETIVIDKFGFVLQGQHRLVSFILAEQMRQLDQSKWGKTPLVYEVLVGYGVSPKPENANTYDLGAKRSLGDVLFRHQKFGKDLSEKEQKKIADVLSGAVRLTWLRAGGKLVSFAPHFPHSEAIEFYGEHPQLLDCVIAIMDLDSGSEGGEKCIKSYLSLSYAAALYYLMAGSKSKSQSHRFWKSFADGEDLNKGDPILVLRNALGRMNADSGSKRDEIIGVVIKAWLAYLAKEKVTTKDIKVPRKKVGDKFVLAEFPRIGGLDSDVEFEESLTPIQLLLLSHLKKSKGTTYKDLQEATALQQGTMTNAVAQETKSGNTNPHSLESRGLVVLEQGEAPEGGDAPISIKLKK
jgi:hypothetical protein